MKRTLFTLIIVMMAVTASRAQGFVGAEYLTASDMEGLEEAGRGHGDMLRLKGRYTLPLSVKINERQQQTAWSATLSVAYATMNNKGEAQLLNPDEVLNASVTVSHIRPLSEHWQLLASLGVGAYSSPDDLAWRSILANGAAIFAYRFSDRLIAGLGLGLTNSYGVPMVLPMGYLNWNTGGRFSLTVDMASGLSVKVSTQLRKAVGLEFTAIELDGMSSVMRVAGETKLYSTMMMCSSLSPILRLSNKMQLRVSAGGVWLRTVRMTDRSLKAFFSQLSDDEGKCRFRPSLRFNIGIAYGF